MKDNLIGYLGLIIFVFPLIGVFFIDNKYLIELPELGLLLIIISILGRTTEINKK